MRDALEARRIAGADKLDEVWDGVVHMSPDPNRAHSDIQAQLVDIFRKPAEASGLWRSVTFNLGPGKHNFRIPDFGLHRSRSGAEWTLTAALVAEIVSPGDESWKKFDFYAAHKVDEVLIIDPHKRSVDWFALRPDRSGYDPTEQSGLIELSRAELAQRIDWPPVED